ncbi:hypothetical protein N0V82_003511 [Gnomoniopsis sp. IMI 355080]|nr:hypothetical protein N0V82_003511 [Gnomoniopsis sp. IMI 355080]
MANIEFGKFPDAEYAVPSVADDVASSLASHLDNGLSPRLSEHESVLEALHDAHGVPLLAEQQLRERAFEVLKNVLLDASPHDARPGPEENKIGLVILPVGSYGLDVWTSSSDLDCLCLGTFSLPTFTDLATQRIQQAAVESGIRIMRKQDTCTGTTLELDFEHHLRIDLTYARTTWPLPSSDPTRPLQLDTLMALKPYRELDYVQRSVPDIANFRLAHRFVRKWAEVRGIYSAQSGYLSGIQITVLLTRVHKCLVTKIASPTVPEILFTFFKEYANFDWEEGVVFDEYFHKTLPYPRTSREPLAILSYFPPRLNTSSTATTSSVRTITAEFQRAGRILDQMDGTWAGLLKVSNLGVTRSGSLASDEFLESHQLYVKIDVRYWGGSITKGRGFIGWVESRLPSLLADLSQRLPDMHVRTWPIRYQEDYQHDAEPSESAADEGEYWGAFVIGLGKAEDKMVLNASGREILDSICWRFAQQVRRDERHYDAAFLQIHPFLRDPAELRSHRIQIDHRNWDAYIQIDDDFEDIGEGQKPGWGTNVHNEWIASSNNRRESATNQPRSAVGLKRPGAGKFRTAADVLNRLRWDASYDHNDFVVGYEDRFLGAMERELDAWKSEQTHEEFIPQHRILYFKRRSDGVIVWERRTRVDLVFGSG